MQLSLPAEPCVIYKGAKFRIGVADKEAAVAYLEQTQTPLIERPPPQPFIPYVEYGVTPTDRLIIDDEVRL